MKADRDGASGSIVRSRRTRDLDHGSALAALALLVVALAACGVFPSLALATPLHAPPLAADTATLAGTATGTVTATATATAAPPSLTLLSPTTGRGPAGARVTVAGANFGSGQVGIFASVHTVCDTQQAALGSTTANGGAFGAYTFTWPTALPPDKYYICATGMTGGAPGYWELTATPPTLSLSTTTMQAGQTVTISGSSFEGAQTVDVSLQQGTTRVHIETVTLGSDGTFSIEYTPDGTLTNAIVLLAQSPAENGAPPALQASATLTILPGGTATVGTTPSPQVTQPSSGVVPLDQGQNDSGNGLLVVLFAGVGLVVLAGLGVVAFFLLRGRGPAAPALAYPGGAPELAGPGGYATTGRMAGVLGRQTGRPGGYGTADRWDEPAVPQIGAVAGWVDEPRPGPDWRPRPMSGQRRDWDDDVSGTYGDDSPTAVSQYWLEESRQQEDNREGAYTPDVAAPPDPWDKQSPDDSLYGGQGATNPANYPDDQDQWTQIQPGRRRQAPNWHHEPGFGSTRPDGLAGSMPMEAAEPPSPPAPQAPDAVDPTPPAEPE